METAVLSADDRVVRVDRFSLAKTGFQHGALLIIEVDTTAPLSAETVVALLRAMKQTANPRPVDIRIAAFTGSHNAAPVDVTQAAHELLGSDDWLEYGNGGAAFLTTGLARLPG
ncbi:hypothetical protein ACXR2T_10175 [Leucobacter sp. HY1910]